MKQLFFGAILLLVLQSCATKQEYSFSDDFSGTSTFEANLAGYKDMLQSDTVNSFQSIVHTLDSSFQVFKSNVSKINGISNVRQLWEEDSTLISFKFDYTTIEALNKAIIAGNNYGFLNLASYEKFSAKKNKVTFIAGKIDRENEAYEGFELSKSMFEHKLILNFKKRVVSIDNTVEYEIGEDGHSVVSRSNYLEIIDKESDSKPSVLNIKLK
ncbi:MAG: hypothetical protein IT221_15510 [Fluviicola sp.]|nr:hypothetical protein [Fluviicola sp.]